MEDAELQDEPLQIRLMDYDTYSANDAIGKVYLNLKPLLLPSSLVVSHDHTNISNNQVKGIIYFILSIFIIYIVKFLNITVYNNKQKQLRMSFSTINFV